MFSLSLITLYLRKIRRGCEELNVFSESCTVNVAGKINTYDVIR